MVFVEGRGAVQCPCVRERKRVRELEAAGIPAKYQAYTLDSYDGRANQSTGRAIVMAQGFVREWNTSRHLGIGFTGPVGVGKTHLMVGILQACFAQGATVRFVELRDLFARIKETFGRDDRHEADIMRPLLECDVLAIDEVGAARDTEWQRECTEKLINGRYMANLSLLYTSNQANLPAGGRPAPNSQVIRTQTAGSSFAAEAQSRFGVASAGMRPDTLGDRIGTPMWSRLQEMCKHVEMDGEDWRTTRRRA